MSGRNMKWETKSRTFWSVPLTMARELLYMRESLGGQGTWRRIKQNAVPFQAFILTLCIDDLSDWSIQHSCKEKAVDTSRQRGDSVNGVMFISGSSSQGQERRYKIEPLKDT